MKQINGGKIERVLKFPSELAVEIRWTNLYESRQLLFYIEYEQGHYNLYGFPGEQRVKKKIASLGPITKSFFRRV